MRLEYLEYAPKMEGKKCRNVLERKSLGKWPLVRRPGRQLLVLRIMSTGFDIGSTEPPDSHTRVSRLFNDAATLEV